MRSVTTSLSSIFNLDVYAKDEFDADGTLIYRPPPLDEVWLDESERRDRRDRPHHQREITEEREQTKRLRIPAPTPIERNTGIDDNNNGLEPPLMVVSDSDDDDSDDESIPPSHQEGEIHTTGGDPEDKSHWRLWRQQSSSATQSLIRKEKLEEGPLDH